jgi:hypothetical protein
MTQSPQPAELVACVADEALLDTDPANLPAAVGRPEAIPPSHTRATLVGIGGTLTAVTLIGGLVLIALGVILALTGGLGLVEVAAVIVGLAAAGTHWGWVHVAEASADALERRRHAPLLDRRRQWLLAIEPYTRHEVTTSVGEDGSISIILVTYRPIRSGDHCFRFVREIERTEVHSGEEPAALVAERAELLRRQAAIDTEQAREHFQVAADARETAQLGSDDERERLAARRAASDALSEQINANLRDPPLIQ